MIVYLAKNSLTGLGYIGITSQSLQRRWYDHCRAADRGSPFALHVAIREFGKLAFHVSSVGTADDWSSLKTLEIELIRKFRTHISLGGYNMTWGGQGQLGRVFSAETRAKIAAAQLGRKHDDERRRRSSEIRKGKKLSAEWVANRTAAQRGKPKSPESNAKRSMTAKARGVGSNLRSPEIQRKAAAARRGIKHTPQAIANMAAAHIGRKASPEARAKMSATRKAEYEAKGPVWQNLNGPENLLKISRALTGRKLSEEHRMNLSIAHAGIKPTPETLKRRSETMKAVWAKKKVARVG